MAYSIRLYSDNTERELQVTYLGKTQLVWRNDDPPPMTLWEWIKNVIGC